MLEMESEADAIEKYIKGSMVIEYWTLAPIATKCSVCSSHIPSNTIPAHNHSFDSTASTPDTYHVNQHPNDKNLTNARIVVVLP